MAPENASLLRSHLGIPVDIEPALADLVEPAKKAAEEVTASWSQRIAGKPLLELRALRLSPERRDSTDVLLLSDFRTGLLQGKVALSPTAAQQTSRRRRSGLPGRRGDPTAEVGPDTASARGVAAST